MKHFYPIERSVKFLICIFLFTTCPMLFAQDKVDCKVLLESLDGMYEGDCKKGLANGKGKAVGTDTYEGTFKKGLPDGEGTYTWSNGDVFRGTFKKGLKEGDGKLTYNPERLADSVLTGFWKQDAYMGLYEYPYKVLSKTGPVNRVVVRKLGNSPHHILIRGEMEMLRERGVNSPYFNGGGFDNVQFPFTADMEASHANVPITFKVIIFEPGRWEVVVNFD
ncbi:MAG: hypothetical protein KAT15_17810 [Bacteroidales bacterium]|nr:hypothetical protein [Bacteroidales bacterium]